MGVFDIFRKKKTSKNIPDANEISNISEVENLKNNNDTQQCKCNSLVNITEFKGFGFWIESVQTINRIFLLMQPAVDELRDKGYVIKSVSASGGVLEFDTGYIPFSGAIYSSFEDAKEKLPLAFAEEESKQAGSLLSEVNFEVFSIIFTKDNTDFRLNFERGTIFASFDIAEIIPASAMKILNNSL